MTSHLSRSCSRPVICDVSCTWARPPGATTMRRLLSTTALSTTAALALGFSLRSGAFVRLCFLAFVRLRFLGVVRPLCVGRSPSSVRRPGRVRFARRRAASRQNCIAEADVHVPRDDEPVRRLRRPSGRKEAEGRPLPPPRRRLPEFARKDSVCVLEAFRQAARSTPSASLPRRRAHAAA